MQIIRLKYKFNSYQEQRIDGVYRVVWNKFSKNQGKLGALIYKALVVFFCALFLGISYLVFVEHYYAIGLLFFPILLLLWSVFSKVSASFVLIQDEQVLSLIEYHLGFVKSKKRIYRAEVKEFWVTDHCHLMTNRHGIIWELIENQGCRFKNVDRPNIVEMKLNPDQLCELAKRLNENWEIMQKYNTYEWTALKLWHLHQEQKDSLSSAQTLVGYELFKDIQQFKLIVKRPIHNKGFMYCQLALSVFLGFALLSFYATFNLEEEPLLVRIFLFCVASAFLIATILGLAYLYRRTIIVQDKATISIKKQYLGGLISFTRSYARKNFKQMDLSSSGQLIALSFKEEDAILLKLRTEESEIYDSDSIRFICQELNRFWS